jgi:hypothetical protein
MLVRLASSAHKPKSATSAIGLRAAADATSVDGCREDAAGADDPGFGHTCGMLTLFGASALTFMMVMYAFERRHRLFIVAFAVGCALSSAYGFLAGTWPFGVVELVWVLIALRRYFGHEAGRRLTEAR